MDHHGAAAGFGFGRTAAGFGEFEFEFEFGLRTMTRYTSHPAAKSGPMNTPINAKSAKSAIFPAGMRIHKSAITRIRVFESCFFWHGLVLALHFTSMGCV
jgi:hypothetical protein